MGVGEPCADVKKPKMEISRFWFVWSKELGPYLWPFYKKKGFKDAVSVFYTAAPAAYTRLRSQPT